MVLGKRAKCDPVLSASPKKFKTTITIRRSIAGKEAFGLVTLAVDNGKRNGVDCLCEK